MFSTIFTSGMGFLSALSPNYLCLVALRFLVGVGVGGSHVFTSWFLEFVPARNRGTCMIVLSLFWTLGTILEASLAWVWQFPSLWDAVLSFPLFMLICSHFAWANCLNKIQDPKRNVNSIMMNIHNRTTKNLVYTFVKYGGMWSFYANMVKYDSSTFMKLKPYSAKMLV